MNEDDAEEGTVAVTKSEAWEELTDLASEVSDEVSALAFGPPGSDGCRAQLN